MASRRAAERGAIGLGEVRPRKDSVWCHPIVMWIYTCARAGSCYDGEAVACANVLTYSC